MITAERLASNKENYDEFGREYDPALIGHVSDILLQLPLFYCARQYFPRIQPNSDLPVYERDDTQFDLLDRSLHLDRYIFMTWGLPNWSRDGSYIHAVDTNVLLLPETVVTPSNIFYFANTGIRYEFQGPRDLEKLEEEYFGKMLTGADWLEVIARRVIDRQSHRDGVYPIVDSGAGMGEIKFAGHIPAEQIRWTVYGWHGLIEKYYPFLYSLGFGHEGSEQARENELYGRDIGVVDPTPESLGIDHATASAVWDILRPQ